MRNRFFVIASIALFVQISPVLGKTITTFIPVKLKPFRITIDVPGFEPWDMLDSYKTILGGSARGDINITIIVEKTKRDTKPEEIREIYGNRAFEHSGLQGSEKKFSIDGISVLSFRWKKPDLSKNDKSVEKWIENRMSYHGYIVNDIYAFDIHLSADMGKCSEDDILKIIKSFKIEQSTEFNETMQLYKSINTTEDIAMKEKFLRSFTKKYPQNPIGSLLLAEQMFNLGDYKKAILLYSKSLANHKLQPIIVPQTLWLCYDGLGMCNGITGKYGQSLRYLDKGYELANSMGSEMHIVTSSYNLACLYAEINKTKEALVYLSKAIKLNPRKKDDARTDSSFRNMKNDSRFNKLVR